MADAQGLTRSIGSEQTEELAIGDDKPRVLDGPETAGNEAKMRSDLNGAQLHFLLTVHVNS